eukprot:SAG31_NODE_19913_length_588_cov_1.292434_2_plen_73_part_00
MYSEHLEAQTEQAAAKAEAEGFLRTDDGAPEHSASARPLGRACARPPTVGLVGRSKPSPLSVAFVALGIDWD